MPQLTPEFVDYLMEQALAEAELAATRGEVPIGAVIARGSTIIGRGSNTTEAEQSVIAHAELNAIKEATKVVSNWRLTDCILCVTLEPCTMCLGAIRLARIPTLIFGAGDSKQGAVGSLYDLSQDPRLGGTPPRVIRGIQEERCARGLRGFFAGRR